MRTKNEQMQHSESSRNRNLERIAAVRNLAMSGPSKPRKRVEPKFKLRNEANPVLCFQQKLDMEAKFRRRLPGGV